MPGFKIGLYPDARKKIEDDRKNTDPCVFSAIEGNGCRNLEVFSEDRWFDNSVEQSKKNYALSLFLTTIAYNLAIAWLGKSAIYQQLYYPNFTSH